MVINRQSIFLLLIIFAFASCIKKEFKDIESIELGISAEFGLPIAKGELSVSEVFKPDIDSSLFLYPDEKGVLHLVFKQNLDTMEFDELFRFEDTLLDEQITLPKPPTGIMISSEKTNITFLLDTFLVEQQIDSVSLASGIIEISFNTYEHYVSTFSITLPEICNEAGEALSNKDFSPTPENNKIIFDLKQSKLNINTSERTKGTLTISLGYNITGKASSGDVPDPSIQVLARNFDIVSAYGKIGNYKEEISTAQELFKQSPLGDQKLDLDLGAPEINILFLNQFGFPFNFEISQFGFMTDGNLEEVTGIPEFIYVEAPSMGSENLFTTSVLEIDKNSNLDIIASKFPEKFVLKGRLNLNPRDVNTYNYIRKENTLISRIEADIPLSFRLAQVELKDTTDVNLSSLEALEENMELFILNTKLINGFPFEVDVQAYFTDDKLTILDSLFEAPVNIASALSNEVPAESIFWINKENQHIRNIKNSKKMIINAAISTKGGDNGEIVDFRTDQTLKIEIVGFTKITI